MKKKKKILVYSQIFLLALTVGLTTTIDNFKAAYAEEQTAKIEETKPLADLMADSKFVSKYVSGFYDRNTSINEDNENNLVPIYFTEWHWGYTGYALYFYVWNQCQYSGYDLDSSLNGVTIQDLDTGSYHFYRIELVGKSENQFYKFKILADDIDAFTFADSNNKRIYSFGQLHVKKESSPNGLATAYVFSKKYEYEGSLANNSLTMDQFDNDVLSINVTGGTYRTQPQEEDVFYHSDLHYVYFNIPNSYLNNYGDVAEYHFTYYPVVLSPIVALQGTILNDNVISGYSSPNASGLSDNYAAKYQWFKAHDVEYFVEGSDEYAFPMVRQNRQWYYGFYNASKQFANFKLNYSPLGLLSQWIQGLAYPEFKDTNAIDLMTELEWAQIRSTYAPTSCNVIATSGANDEVSTSVLDSYINFNNLQSWSIYNDSTRLQQLFPTYNSYLEAIKVEEHLRYDQDSYELRTYSRAGKSYAINGIYLDDENEDMWEDFASGSESIKPIEAITSSNASTDRDTWKLENNSAAINAFHDNYVAATNSGSTPYIFRFAPTKSLILPLYYSELGTSESHHGLGEMISHNNCPRVGSIFSGSGIYNLVSLDLTFQKDGVETIIPLAADPKNINPSWESPVSSQDKDKGSETWNNIKSILLKVLMIVAIIIAGIIALKIVIWLLKLIFKKRK